MIFRFVGDLNPRYELEMHKGTQIGESGRQFNAFLIGEEIPEGLYKAVEKIREYIDSVFENNAG